LIGPGAIGELHARALSGCGVDLVAVAGNTMARATTFAERFSVAHAYDDVDSMLDAQGLDAVIVASPSGLHVEHTLAVLAHGADVLCEVPAALSLQDGLRVDAAAGRNAVMIAHTLRFSEPYQYLHSQAAAGVTHLVLRRLQLRHANVGWTGQVRSWTDSVLWHHTAHLVDFALWVLGPGRVSVCGGVGPVHPTTEAPMDVAAVLRAPDGRLASIAASYNARIPVNDVTLIGPDSTVIVENGSLRDESGLLGDAAPPDELAPIQAQDRYFIDQVVHHRQVPVPSINDELEVLRVLDRLANPPSEAAARTADIMMELFNAQAMPSNPGLEGDPR
jgi:2-hydroxy-4-carboxymuconate semialdehyde hemiacetal dehydrogenase